MLYTSGNNLFKEASRFIKASENNVTLFSAFLKLRELKELNISKKITQIVVRWEIEDLCKGASDIELYNYCLENNITLLRNTRLHMKAIWNNDLSIFLGSANVSARGIGEKNKYNYELNAKLDNLELSDLQYLNKVISKSEYVTKDLYEKIVNLVDEIELPSINFPNLETEIKREDYFLLSNLPMTENIKELYIGYSQPQKISDDKLKYIAHDLELYEVPSGLNENIFYNHIENVFNNHPFITKLKGYIEISVNQSLSYGNIVRFIQKNTTTVPTPRSWELKQKQIVNILYDWICDLDDNLYWNIPGEKSQVIYYTKKRDYGETK